MIPLNSMIVAVFILATTAATAVAMQRLHRLPHASANRTILLRRIGGVLVLLFGCAVAAQILGFARIPPLVLAIYSLALPAALLAVIQPTLSGFTILLFEPFEVGEWVDLVLDGGPEHVLVLDIGIASVKLWNGSMIISQPNATFSSLTVRRAARAGELAEPAAVLGVTPHDGIEVAPSH